jgi:hypothetical protein
MIGKQALRLAAACVLLGAVLLAVRPFQAAPLPRSKPVPYDDAPLRKLMTLLPPPAKPTHTGTDAQWRAAEEKLGSPFPEEYKHLIRAYGYLTINQGELRIRNPFSKGIDEGNLFMWLEGFRQVQHSCKELQLPSLPVWPEKDGLLPIGGANSHDLCYRTRGNPSEWTIVVLSREGELEEHPCGLVEFLTRMAEGRLESMIRVADFLDPPLSIP